MTPQELKSSILQLAVQGKLVEQRADEGTAEELYAQIQAEKQRLIKEGKIKKEKPLPEITEDEIPFDIPESWKWVRLKDIVYNHGQTIPQNTFSYVDIGSIDNKSQKLNKEETIIPAEKAPSRARKVIKMGDILYSTVRPYLHNICIVDREFSCTPISSTGFAVFTCFGSIYNKYLFHYLLSPTFDKYANDNKNSKGVAYPAINDKRLYSAIIALPPLAEQKRIVAKIEELLPYVDRYEKAWSKLEDFNKRFPSDMQKSVLQMAIQGKLVEQRPEEGTAEELYTQIQAEKQRLIKDGKIKKEKPLPEISEDEIPFDIPENWKWVKIGSLFNVGTGMTPLKSELKFYQNGTIPWVTSSLTNKRYIQHSDDYITEYALKNTSLSVYKKHTLIIAMYGQGKTRGQVSELLIDSTINQACAALENIIICQDFINYIFYYFKFNYEVIRKKAEGTSQPNLNLNKIKNTIVPLPPLAEQKRIVQKLDEILPLCEKLK